MTIFTPRSTRARITAGLASIALVTVACGGPSDPEPDQPETATTDAATTSNGPADAPGIASDAPDDQTDVAVAPVAVPIPDTPAGRQLTWLLEQMQPDSAITAGDAQARLAASFLEQVPAAEVVVGMQHFAQQGPWIPTQIDGDDHQLQATITATRSRLNQPDRLQVILAVDPTERIEGLRLVPAPEVTIDDLDDAVTELQSLADDSSLLVATIDGGVCTPVFEHHSYVPYAVASAAKLYVLLAVSDAVENGTLTWDTEVVLTDKDRSLPTGQLQDEAAGTVLTVSELATGMMSISDNTATDHLITLVGRDAVEDAVERAGHADPALLAPFLRTREIFAIGWDEERRLAWRDVDGDLDARRALVDQLPAGTGEVEVADVTDVVWTEGVDWFASLDDLCAAHAALDLDDAEVAEAVGTNPGIMLDPDVWPRFAFKGGATPGVLSLTWSLDRDDGDRWFVGMALNDRRGVDETTTVAVATAVVDLVAEHDR